MIALPKNAVGVEIASLINESGDELDKGEAKTACSLLLEAQLLLSELIQSRLNEIHCLPPLAPARIEFFEEINQPMFCEVF